MSDIGIWIHGFLFGLIGGMAIAVVAVYSSVRKSEPSKQRPDLKSHMLRDAFGRYGNEAQEKMNRQIVDALIAEIDKHCIAKARISLN